METMCNADFMLIMLSYGNHVQCRFYATHNGDGSNKSRFKHSRKQLEEHSSWCLCGTSTQGLCLNLVLFC